MNFLYDVEIAKVRDSRPPNTMSEFFVPCEPNDNRRKSKKVEQMIQKYSIKLYQYSKDPSDDSCVVLMHDFNHLVEDIQQLYISSNYKPLMSWLINRAFVITPGIKCNRKSLRSTLNKNRSILLKTLYDVNPKLLLECFKENKDNSNKNKK